MVLRSKLGNWLLSAGRRLARADGRELAVDLSNHSIDIQMTKPDREEQAWDPDLYSRGNVFLEGYANPIKPVARHNKELEEPDAVDVEESDEGDTGDDVHTEVISSERYAMYMKQDLISQLLNPQEKWRILAYAILGIGGLVLVNLVMTASAAGVF